MGGDGGSTGHDSRNAGAGGRAPALIFEEGIGQATLISSAVGGALLLPAAGTWDYSLRSYFLSSGGHNGNAVRQRAAGGSVIATAVAGVYHIADVWRMS